MATDKQEKAEASLSCSPNRRQFPGSARSDDALQALASTELNFAVAQLQQPDPDQQRAVHQCRRAIKRMRALVRIGHAVPGAKLRGIDRCLRDAGRTLAAARDAAESGKTLKKLIIRNPKLSSLKGMKQFREPAGRVDLPKKKTVKRLEQARVALPHLFADGERWTFGNVMAGVELTYAAAADCMSKFSEKPNAEGAHSWRKCVQRLVNQVRIVSTVFPGEQELSTHALRRLANVLGEHNDLAVLRSRLKSMRRELPKKTRETVHEAAKCRQRGLREQALAIGKEAFQQNPKQFRKSLEKNINVIALI